MDLPRRATMAAVTRRPTTLAVAALMAASAAWAVLVSRLAFPHLSADSDETVYLLQADALRHGKLFPPAHAPSGAFVPWLSVLRHGHYVTKYTPVHPTVLALSRTVFFSWRAGLAVVAAGLVLFTYLLGSRLLGTPRDGLIAAAFVAASPLVLVQTATYLPYAEITMFSAAFAVAALAAHDRGGPWRYVLAGAVFGIALFARPFDALLFGAPFLVWLVVRRWRAVGWLGLGAAPVLALMLLYFRAATGDAFQPSFRLLDPSDMVGFGRRRMLPFEAPVDYELGLGARALFTHALLLTFWCFGGLLVIGLSVAGWRLLRRRPGTTSLAVAALAIPLGYLFFWGTYNALTWGAPFHLGPYYWMPIVVPLSVLGAAGFIELMRVERWLAYAAIAGMIAIAAFTAGAAVHAADQFSASDRLVWNVVQDAQLTQAVVFLREFELGNPIQWAVNDAGYSGAIVWAIDRGPCRNAAVMAAFPDRRGYQLLMTRGFRARPPDPRFRAEIVPADVTCPSLPQ